MAKASRTFLKEQAQEALMVGIANVLGYYGPDEDDRPIPQEQRDEFREIMKREADRIARLFGYDGAWTN